MSPSSGAARVAARRVAGRVVRGVARAADVVARPPRGIVVLAYHQVGAPRPGGVNLDPVRFEDEMAMLAAGYDAGPVVDLDEALIALAGTAPAAGSHDPVVITFDDGTADFIEHAVPVLAKYRLPVTLYLATAFIDEGRSFWDDGTVLSWAALADAVSTGLVSVGSHTHGHTLLDRAPASVVDAELDRSIDLIGERLAVTARHFAYPKARPPSPAADRAVRARFASAARAGGRPNRYGRTDPWQLWRTPVVRDDTPADVARKATGRLRLEGALRERLDDRRYAGVDR